jgi:hypothetical protein
MPLKDLKEGLSSARKPDITHVRVPFLNYTARPCEYGSDKYERGNFLRPLTDEGYTGTPTPADFERYRAYLRAAASHIFEVLDSMEKHLSTDPKLEDTEGMIRACYAIDTDAKPGCKVGPSLLPHAAPACASLMMAISQATECGLLPRDPGTPWRDHTALWAGAGEPPDVWRNKEIKGARKAGAR